MAERDNFIYLASTSVRRQRLVERIGAAYRARAPRGDEIQYPHEPPASYVERIAKRKALADGCGINVLDQRTRSHE